MTDLQVVLLSRLVGGYILAASGDDPNKLTSDLKGYNENLLHKKEWQEQLAKYEAATLAGLGVAVPPGGGGVPTP